MQSQQQILLVSCPWASIVTSYILYWLSLVQKILNTCYPGNIIIYVHVCHQVYYCVPMGLTWRLLCANGTELEDICQVLFWDMKKKKLLVAFGWCTQNKSCLSMSYLSRDLWLGAVTSLASSTSQMSTFLGLWAFSSLPSFIIQIVELTCDTVSVLQSLKCISIMWCGISVVRRSSVLLKKLKRLCSKQRCFFAPYLNCC